MRTNGVPAQRTPVEDGFTDAKFAIPRALHVVARPRLYDRLDAGAESPVSLVSAPAGWGKTLLVSSWLDTRRAGAPAAWFSVGPHDDDLRTFWPALATALARVVGEPAATALRQAASSDAPPTRLPGIVTAAMARVPSGTVVVVDNLHQITSPEVHASLLEAFGESVSGPRWIVTTRRDPPWPLHRLRLAGLVAEVRAADLAFGADEGREMFDRLGVPLTTEQLDQLLRRTDGWAAGLRMAALPLRGTGADVAGFVDTFSGTHSAVSEYMRSEVLRPHADHALRFLESICILDLVCAELADAITGEDDGAAMLAELASSNLFVQPIGGDGRWFRLHALVADVLRGRIAEPRARRDLHRRAAQWYRRHGLHAPAVQLAVRGGLFRLAAEIVGLHVLGLVLRGQARELDTMLSSVAYETVLTLPELAAGLAGARMMQGHANDVESLVSAATVASDELPAPRRDRVLLVLDLVRIATSRLRGDLSDVVATCRRIPDAPQDLETLGFSEWGLVRGVTLSNRGTAEFWLGDLDAAEKYLRMAMENGASAGPRPRLNAQSHLALLEAERGRLTEAQDHAHDATAEAEAAGWGESVQVVTAYLALARLHLDRDEPAAVEPWLRRVDGIVAEVPEPHVRLTVAVLRAEHQVGTTTVDDAADELRSALAALAGAVPAGLTDRGILTAAELAADRHDVAGAKRLLSELRDPASDHAVLGAVGLALLEQQLDRAAEQLSTLRPASADVRTQVATDVLWSLVADARGDDDAALDALDRALRGAAPQRLRLPFVRRAAALRRLLAVAVERGTPAAGFAVDLLQRTGPVPHPRPVPVSSTPVALTPSEILTVRYLASTLTNAEIAAELHVSINTVKTHQRTVYRKLGVGRRRDAVRRARDLHIL